MSFQKLSRPLLVALVIAAISLAHYLTDPSQIWWHVAYQDLCYAPILVAAYWFGMAGGVATAVVAALGSGVHFHSEWHDNTPFIVSMYGQGVGFVIAGAVGGALAQAQRRAMQRYQQALAAAETAHAELRASHEQLVRADRLSSLGEIAAGLAHEIGNPLAGVKGALEIIASRAAASTPEAEFSAIAAREIARLEGLIEEFLRYARPRAPHRTRSDIFDVLERVTSLVGPEAAGQGVSVTMRRSSVPPALIDADQMVQVFMNVVLNAVQATPAGGRVEIGASISDAMLAVDVRDEGPGIPPEHVGRIFDPFFSTKKRGTGLGLSISNRIVQSHGGRIEVLQPGKGSIVRVLIPVEQGIGPSAPGAVRK